MTGPTTDPTRDTCAECGHDADDHDRRAERDCELCQPGERCYTSPTYGPDALDLAGADLASLLNDLDFIPDTDPAGYAYTLAAAWAALLTASRADRAVRVAKLGALAPGLLTAGADLLGLAQTPGTRLPHVLAASIAAKRARLWPALDASRVLDRAGIDPVALARAFAADLR